MLRINQSGSLRTLFKINNLGKDFSEAQLVKERIAKEIADRLLQEHSEEEDKRKSGSAIAPPQALIEQDLAPSTSGNFNLFARR